MDPFGSAWLLDRSGNCIEVYAHPSETFEFESVVDVVSQYGSDADKVCCDQWRATHSESSKQSILNSYNQNWCKVRRWRDNKLTFRITSTDFNWYQIIVDFLLDHPFVQYALITVENVSGYIYWDDVSYIYSIDPANEAVLSSVFSDSSLITV